MTTDPEALRRALDALEASLEAFRTAYTMWLGGGGDRDDDALSQALADAEAPLNEVRRLLANAGNEQSYP